jgi:hypothetical protein
MLKEGSILHKSKLVCPAAIPNTAGIRLKWSNLAKESDD